MVHIILLILKIIGIVIAVVLGLLLLCICAVLFVPVRYRARASYDESFEGEGRVSWLLHLVSIRAAYKSGEDGPYIVLKIFGRRFFDSRENEKKSSDNTKDKAPRAGKPQKAEVSDKKAVTSQNKAAPAASVQKLSSEEAAQSAAVPEHVEPPQPPEAAAPGKDAGVPASRRVEPPREDAAGEAKTPAPHVLEPPGEEAVEPPSAAGPQPAPGGSAPGIFGRLMGRIRTLFDRIRALWMRAVDFVKNFRAGLVRLAGRLRSMGDKKDAVLGILFDEANRPAFTKTKQMLFKVLRHLKPTKLSGNVYFGFEDPAATGYTLGVLSLLYPVYEDHVMLYPDFEKKIIKGNVYCAGRLRASVFLWAVCRLIFDKDIRRIIRSFKKI